jgi:hypothetical protein
VAIQNTIGGNPGEPHSGQDGADRCVFYGGKIPFRNGFAREGVCNAWEEDGAVEIEGRFYILVVINIHVVMKQKILSFLIK